MSSKHNVWCLIVCLTLVSTISAAEPPPMEVRVYAVPPDMGSTARPTRSDARDVLSKNGIPFPDGAVAIYENMRSRLTVRNTPENLALIDEFVRGMTSSPMHDADFTVTVIEGAATKLEELSAIQNDASGQSEKLQRLMRAAAEKKDGLQIARTAFISARSSDQCIVEAGVDHSFTEKVELDEKGHASVSTESRMAGLAVEMEPTIGIDDETIDVNIAVILSLAAPE